MKLFQSNFQESLFYDVLNQFNSLGKINKSTLQPRLCVIFEKKKKLSHFGKIIICIANIFKFTIILTCFVSMMIPLIMSSTI